MRKSGKTGIMVQVWGTIAKAIKRDFRALHIKRDAYLNDLLASEIDELDREVAFRNLDEVRQRIQSRRLPDRVKLTIDLDDRVARRIDEVLTKKNIPRDSFINRVLFFLLAKRKILQALGVAYEGTVQSDVKPLDDAWSSLHDPFYNIRSNNDGHFYTLFCFPDGEGEIGKGWPNLFGMNCAISEEQWRLMDRPNEELLADLLGITNITSEA